MSQRLKSLRFANEFLKITHGIQVENQREDKLPEEVIVGLANSQLDSYIEENKLEPDMLVWGLLSVIEMVMKFAELDHNELTGAMDSFINFIEEKGELDE